MDYFVTYTQILVFCDLHTHFIIENVCVGHKIVKHRVDSVCKSQNVCPIGTNHGIFIFSKAVMRKSQEESCEKVTRRSPENNDNVMRNS